MAIPEIEAVQGMVSAGTYADLVDLQARVEAGDVVGEADVWMEIQGLVVGEVPMVLKMKMRLALGAMIP